MGARAEDAATVAGGTAAAAEGWRSGAAISWSPARGATRAGPSPGATGAPGAAAWGPAVGGTARASSSQSALTGTIGAARAREPGGGSAGFRSSDPGVAPSRGARRDPSRVGAGRRRGGARLHDAYPRRPRVRDQEDDLRHGRNRPGIPPGASVVGGPYSHRGGRGWNVGRWWRQQNQDLEDSGQ